MSFVFQVRSQKIFISWKIGEVENSTMMIRIIRLQTRANLIYIYIIPLFWGSSSRSVLISKPLMRQKAVTKTNLMIWTFIYNCLFQSMLTIVNILYACSKFDKYLVSFLIVILTSTYSVLHISWIMVNTFNKHSTFDKKNKQDHAHAC